MNTQTNKPRFTWEQGVNLYMPLPGNKAAHITIYKDMYLRNMINVRTRDWALLDYADHGVKNYDLLVALTAKAA